MNVTFMQDGSQPAVDAGPGKPKLYHLGTLRGIQEALAFLGYDPGAIDGVDGSSTEAAVAEFQTDCGLEQDGQCVGETLPALASTLTDQGYEVDGV